MKKIQPEIKNCGKPVTDTHNLQILGWLSTIAVKTAGFV